MTATVTKTKLQTLFNKRFMSRFHENIDRFVYQTLIKKKQSQDTITKFIQTLVKFISKSHIDEIMYVRLVAEEPTVVQHYRKLLSDWTTQQKN